MAVTLYSREAHKQHGRQQCRVGREKPDAETVNRGLLLRVHRDPSATEPEQHTPVSVAAPGTILKYHPESSWCLEVGWEGYLASPDGPPPSIKCFLLVSINLHL